MLGVTNEAPVAKELPPVLVANQDIIPAEAVAAKLTVPEPFLEAGVVLVIVGVEFTFTVAILFVSRAELQLFGELPPLDKLVIVIVVVPEFESVFVVKFPEPAVVTVIVVVFPVAKLGADKL
jgi:hypothetical protein